MGALASSSKSPNTLGIYDNFYPKQEWSWYKDSGSWVQILKHNSIRNCFVAVNVEPWDYEDGNWALKETRKIFGKTKYRIIRVEIDERLWCYTYTPVNDSIAIQQLNIYMTDSCKACQEAAEQIILNKEK